MTAHEPETVVEISWEVVNKVGGIHTVLRSKADLPAKQFKNYLLIGPLFTERRDINFAEEAPPERIRQAFEHVRQHGINCVYGTWLIPGNPRTVLIDARQAAIDLNAVKGGLYERFGVDSIRAGYDFDEPLKWSWAVGMFLERLSNSQSDVMVVHAHEWLAGGTILYLRTRGVRAGTVFTTHATMLGRTVSGATDIPLYDALRDIDPAEMAARLGVTDKHTMEVACAHACHVFTTVSEITGVEAEHLLGRKPDVLLFNGIQAEKYPTLEEASLIHARAREQIRDFLDYYFFSHYTFDLDQSLVFFVSGRYEYQNKGLDVLTDALGRLNEHLKRTNHRKTIICFFFIPGETHGIKTELLEERATFSHLQQFVNEHAHDIVRKIIRNASQLTEVDCHDLLSEQARKDIIRMAHQMEHDGNPPLVTHNIPDEERDTIVAGLRANGLLNRAEDKVKVIWYPIYLTGSDGLLDLPYAEVVAGSHLGIFPSYYEPWGYTPVEAAAVGIPAITTDLAGFGRFVAPHTKGTGVFVLRREHRTHEQVVEDLFRFMAKFCDLDKFERQEEKIAAKRISQRTEWQTFIKEYYKAYAHAHENAQ